MLVNYNEMARLIDDMNQDFWKNAGEVPAPGLLLPVWAVMMGLRLSMSQVDNLPWKCSVAADVHPELILSTSFCSKLFVWTSCTHSRREMPARCSV